MNYNVTLTDMTLLNQRTKETFIRLELLDSTTNQILDYFDSLVISGTLSISADSNIRRTLDVTLFMKDNTLIVGENGKVWFNRIVNCKLGYRYLRDQQIYYYPVGRFYFDQNTYNISKDGKTLQLKMNDPYCCLNGNRNGQLTASNIDIPAGSNIRNAIISTLQLSPYNFQYNIGDVGNLGSQAINIYNNTNYNTVPYDLKFSIGTKISDIIEKLVELYSGWQCFFDIDGAFTIQPLPTLQYESDILDAETIETNGYVISEQRENKMSDIHNVVYVLGETLTADATSTVCTNSGSKYIVTFNDSSMYYSSGNVYGVQVNVANSAGQTMQFNSLTAYPIVDANGNAITANIMSAGIMYCFKFQNNMFYFLGQFIIQSCSILVSQQPSSAQMTIDQNKYNTNNIFYRINTSSPFCRDKDNLGDIVDVKHDGDYSKIYSNDLCIQRSNLELWYDTNWSDTITLDSIVIPWLDVQTKFQYHSLIYNDTKEYIIKSISIDLKEQTMSLQAMTYYPLYPSILG